VINENKKGTRMKNENEWVFRYDRWDPDDQQVREALCTLSNGYWGTRGAAEEATQSGCHYPGAYLAGGYDRLDKIIAGETINHEVLVNWPNWLYLTFSLEDGSWFDLEKVHIRNYCQKLDLQRGMLTRDIHIVEPEGRETHLHSVRLVHMRYPHLAALKWTFIPQNWSGRIRIRSGMDARIINENVERYDEMNGKHFRVLKSGLHRQGELYMVTEALQSHLQTAQGLRTHCSGAPVIEQSVLQEPDIIMEEFLIDVDRHSTFQMEKITALYHSRDRAIFEPRTAVQQALSAAGSFHQLQRPHQAAWSRLWEIGDIRIESRPEDQLMLRLYLFHLLQTASPHLADLDAGLSARGLAGEMYHGHIFWDELFAFPFLNIRLPDVSRSLILYRARREPCPAPGRAKGMPGDLLSLEKRQ
jgi:alpha,alpha-trehalase